MGRRRPVALMAKPAGRLVVEARSSARMEALEERTAQLVLRRIARTLVLLATPDINPRLATLHARARVAPALLRSKSSK